jgi:hypothetical protein
MAVTAVASATSSTSLVAGNTSRKGLVIENSDANRLYVLLGAGTASATNYSFSLAQNENAGVYGIADYTGEVNGIWAGDGSGYAMVTVW